MSTQPCRAGALSFHALLASYLQLPRSDDGAGVPNICLDSLDSSSLEIASVALYGSNTAIQGASQRAISASEQEDSVAYDWWARLRLQEENEATRQALGALVAPAGGSSPAAPLLLSAACRRAWPEVVQSAVHLLTAGSTLCALEALRMLASETTTRAWVWHRRDAVCATVREALCPRGSQAAAGSCSQVLRAAKILRDMGWVTEALQLSHHLLDSLAPPLPSADIAACRACIGGTLSRLGKYEGAFVEHRAVLDILLAALGERHPDVAASRWNIGGTLCDLGKYEEALVEQRAALDVYLAVLGERHPNVADTRNDIGGTLCDLGKYEEALVEQQAALDIRLAVVGERHPEVATSHGNIGSTLSRLGKYEEALVEHRAALDIELAVLGERHPEVAASRWNIGSTLSRLGKYEEALVEQRAALDIELADLGERLSLIHISEPTRPY